MLSKFPKITPLIGDIGDLNPGLFIAEALGKVKLRLQNKGLRWDGAISFWAQRQGSW